MACHERAHEVDDANNDRGLECPDPHVVEDGGRVVDDGVDARELRQRPVPRCSTQPITPSVPSVPATSSIVYGICTGGHTWELKLPQNTKKKSAQERNPKYRKPKGGAHHTDAHDHPAPVGALEKGRPRHVLAVLVGPGRAHNRCKLALHGGVVKA